MSYFVNDFCLQVSGQTPWITLNGVDVAGASFVFGHLAKTAAAAGDLHRTLGPAEKAVSSAMTIMLDEKFDRCLRMDREDHAIQYDFWEWPIIFISF